MKPTEQQLKTLQRYLKELLNFKESYEEVYDHILSALADRDDIVNFEATINDIIRRDLGGHANLLKIEEGISNSITAEQQKKLKGYFIGLLTFPAVSYVAFAAALVYALLKIAGFSPFILKGIVLAIVLIPTLLALFRHIHRGYVTTDRARTVHDVIFGTVAWFPLWVFGVVVFYFPEMYVGLDDAWSVNYPSLTTLYIMAALLYDAAVFKLYVSEFRLLKRQTI